MRDDVDVVRLGLDFADLSLWGAICAILVAGAECLAVACSSCSFRHAHNLVWLHAVVCHLGCSAPLGLPVGRGPDL
jgi:hypothetical protein